jgi:hypothetical protein
MMARLLPFRRARRHRHGPPRFRLSDSAIAALLLSCPDASDGKLDSRLACAYARAGSRNGMRGQIRQYGAKAAGGGRGFNSSKRGRPATAPILMRRFFSSAKTFDYFFGNQIFKRRSRQFLLAEQSGLAIEVPAFEHLFSRRGDGRAIRKIVAKFPGGGEGS